MGKEWLNWIGNRNPGEDKRQKTAEAGCCMGSVFQLLFDLNHPETQSNFYSLDENNSSKGVEAPRNSLDSEEEEKLKFPRRIQIKKVHELSSETGYDSPGAKTPNLVARLMGLDLLPGSDSPLTSSKSAGKFSGKTCFEDDIGVRSLPETPRRRSDVDCHHHRLSLQITEFVSPELASTRRGRLAGASAEKENSTGKRSPKQGKSRRRFVGLDITNAVDIQREIWPENASPAKRNPSDSEKPRKKNHQIPCEDRNRRALNKKQNKISNRKCQRISPSTHQKIETHKGKHRRPTTFNSNSKQNSSSKFQSQFQSSERRTQLLSCNTSRSYESRKINTAVPDSGNGSATALPASVSAEYGDRIRRILRRSRCRNRTTLPINPSHFDKLELGVTGGDRRSRKLICHLVDEILGAALVEELRRKTKSSPAVPCGVLEDIDSSIDMDLCNVFAEGGGIVGEIEGAILERLVMETAAVIGGRT
ncbi:hypothetical protein M569_14107 [Genlisea aurea]|uniref:DUF3741 domain-containing protein n=1 Tax=Genlisea aurea TaxID=192259 RepID=S8C1P8_9LAMI|nr:hypothetical protein M569_14107 [Genlisea aurea]